MLFQKRQDFLPEQDAGVGETIEFELTREFHIESILLKVKITNGATGPTYQAGVRGGDILSRITVTVSDGATTRDVVASGGGSLIEWARQTGGLDPSTMASHYAPSTTNSGVWYMYIPIWFAPPQINDPVRSIFLLPAPRYNQNLILRVQCANAADIYSAGAIDDIDIEPMIVRRVVTARDWVTYDTEFLDREVAYPNAGANQRHELDIPGSYTGLLLRTYLVTTGARGNISQANGVFQLKALDTTIRRFTLEQVAAENARSAMAIADVGVANYPQAIPAIQGGAGEYFLDFMTDQRGSPVSELSSLLDSNIYAATGARIHLLQDIAGGSECKVIYTHRRIYGELPKALKILKP